MWLKKFIAKDAATVTVIIAIIPTTITAPETGVAIIAGTNTAAY